MKRRPHQILIKAFQIGITLCLLFLSRPVTLSAQQAAAAINGTVTDTSGAIIPGATISLSNSATGRLQHHSDQLGGHL